MAQSTLHTSQDDIIASRRAAVEQLRLRQLAITEIPAALEKLGLVNPETKLPWSPATIQKDLVVLRAQWKRSARIDTEEHTARELAEISEVKRLAWQKSKPDSVINALKLEAQILGTLAPVKIDIDIKVFELVKLIVGECEAIEADPAEVFNAIFSELAAARAELPGAGAERRAQLAIASLSGENTEGAAGT